MVLKEFSLILKEQIISALFYFPLSNGIKTYKPGGIMEQVSTTLYLWDCYNQRYIIENFIISLEDWKPGYWPSELQLFGWDLPPDIVRVLVLVK